MWVISNAYRQLERASRQLVGTRECFRDVEEESFLCRNYCCGERVDRACACVGCGARVWPEYGAYVAWRGTEPLEVFAAGCGGLPGIRDEAEGGRARGRIGVHVYGDQHHVCTVPGSCAG